MNDYQTTINSLFQRISLRRTDLKLIERLLEKVGNPHDSFPSIHVAGTNGKGSVSTKLASALQHAGYRVGLFTSPHIESFEERIQINGVKIPKEKVITYHAQIDDPEANFFECATCICFQYFKEEKVDVAIIEAGLGGTLDATNVITPLLSIITSISLDHTEYLGDTLEEIATQKAGIIKTGVPVILGPKAQLNPVLEKGRSHDAPITCVEETAPFFEIENQSIAKTALQTLSRHFKISEADIDFGIKLSPPCRFEKRNQIIFDVAHNPGGFASLAGALKHNYPNQTFRFVIGISSRKDLKGCLQEIAGLAKHIHFIESGREDSVPAAELKRVFQAISTCPSSSENSIEAAIENAKTATSQDEIIVVCGSFYIMKQALLCIESLDHRLSC